MTPGPSRTLPSSATIREVGPRDGLQVEAPLPVAARVELIHALAAAGLRHIEVGSFVHPKAVPAMAGAADVIAALELPDDVTVTALVPNERGARDALAAGVDELSVTASASAEYGRRNVNMTAEEQQAQIERIAGLAADAGVPVDVVVSCAFGSPYEGAIDPADVAATGRRALEGGATSVAYADTTGMANPQLVAAVIDATGPDVGLHLHETRGTGLVNAYAGLTLGVTRFDTSVGGLGGSPFAKGAAGNVATEGLAGLLAGMGVATGVDLDALLDVCARLRELVGHALPSPLATHALDLKSS